MEGLYDTLGKAQKERAPYHARLRGAMPVVPRNAPEAQKFRVTSKGNIPAEGPKK